MKIARAFAAAMTFWLGYTLWRIRRIVVARQKEIDERWNDATSERND